MLLYKVRNGIIEIEKVRRETRNGWRQLNNGFYNRRRIGNWIYLDETYLTTDVDEAIQWAKEIRSYLHDLTQVSTASIDDVNVWRENDSVESNIPKSRIVYGKNRTSRLVTR